jgi:hypothetical protein
VTLDLAGVVTEDILPRGMGPLVIEAGSSSRLTCGYGARLDHATISYSLVSPSMIGLRRIW